MAMKKLGHEFSMKLGFRSRTSAQTDPEADADPSRSNNVLEPNWAYITDREIRSDKAQRPGYYSSAEHSAQMLEKQSYPRNGGDSISECHRSMTLPNSRPRRPMLARKSHSDLTPLSHVNMRILVEGQLVVNTFVNGNNNYDRSLGSNGAQWVSPNGDRVGDPVVQGSSSGDIKEMRAHRHVKRSKSFSGWLSGKTRWKQCDDKGDIEKDNKTTRGNTEPQDRSRLKRSGSFSEKLKGKMKFLNKDSAKDSRSSPTEKINRSAALPRPLLNRKASSDLVDYKHLIPAYDYSRRLSDQTETRRLSTIKEPTTNPPLPYAANPGCFSLDRGLVRQGHRSVTRKRSNSLERVLAAFPNQLDVSANMMQRSTSCDARLSFTDQSDTHLNDDGTLETNLCTTEL